MKTRESDPVDVSSTLVWAEAFPLEPEFEDDPMDMFEIRFIAIGEYDFHQFFGEPYPGGTLSVRVSDIDHIIAVLQKAKESLGSSVLPLAAEYRELLQTNT